ncbi:hypothetical protein MMC2321_01437 [Chitinophaga sp. MM2321]
MEVFCTRLTSHLSPQLFGEYLSLLPDALQQKNNRYKTDQDKQLHLAGQLLLLEVLQRWGYDRNCLQQVQYNPYHRPYIPGEVDFNISHSGDYVLCAVGRHVKVGIDIEAIKNIDLPDFTEMMTDDQWGEIHAAADPVGAFFSYWAIKESVMKADSRGIYIPLNDIVIENDTARYDGVNWWLFPLHIDPDYCACVAVNKAMTAVPVQYISLEDLLPVAGS